MKRRKQRQSRDARDLSKKITAKKNRVKKRREIFHRAEKYARTYRNEELDRIRLSREARKHGNYYVPDEPKLAFVIRIRGINGVSPK
ncbi:hypothetical protein, partial [Salmonella sp. s54395]|uniref:hypothetical protein n=1 Tax=Salmonella sp. s54395 TaxID=3159664 RepID=UPI00397F385C